MYLSDIEMGRLIACANQYIGLAPERDREHNHVPWEFLGHIRDLLGSIDASYTIGKVLALIAEEERREHFEEELRLSRWAAEPEQAEQKAPQPRARRNGEAARDFDNAACHSIEIKSEQRFNR